ncbi:MAG: hypothetical protein RLY16_1687 [Bacteroidota bacterium]|jgi:deoxyribose-phosphate aldolase
MMMITTQQLVFAQLNPFAKLEDTNQWLQQVIPYQPKAVLVLPMFVKSAVAVLSPAGIPVQTVIGYPYGHSAIEAKVAELILAILDGAKQIELMINNCALQNNDWQYLANELNTIAAIAQSKQCQLIVNIEAAMLSQEDIIRCCDLYGIAGVSAVKSGSDHEGPADVEIVKLMRTHLADSVAIEVAAGLKSVTVAQGYLRAGANWLATTDGMQIATLALTSEN